MLSWQDIASIGSSSSRIVSEEEDAILRLLVEQARVSMERGDDMPRLTREAPNILDRALQFLTRRSDAVMAVVTREVRRALARSVENDLASVGAALGELPRAVRDDLTRSAATTLVGVRDIVRRDNLAMAPAAEATWLNVVARHVAAYNTGAVSMEDALRAAVRELADGGIEYVDYASGARSRADVAVRRHLRSQIGQAAGRSTLDQCRALGIELVEVTRTATPRPSHALWEGRKYRIVDTRDDYPDLWTGTGYEGLRGPFAGLADRLLGVNCGHSFGPTYDWMEPRWGDDPYTEEEKLERYRLTQEQRRLEREVRRAKRRVTLLEGEGLPASADRSRLGVLQRRLRELVDGHDFLHRDYGREWVATPSGRQPTALTSQRMGRAEFMRQPDTLETIRREGVPKTAVEDALRHLAPDLADLSPSGRQRALSEAVRVARARSNREVKRAAQDAHVPGTDAYARRLAGNPDVSVVWPRVAERARELVRSGVLEGRYDYVDVMRTPDGSTVGIWVDVATGSRHPTDRFTVHYSKGGFHIVPARPSWRGGDGR